VVDQKIDIAGLSCEYRHCSSVITAAKLKVLADLQEVVSHRAREGTILELMTTLEAYRKANP
jgi:hypothetical protein